VSDSIQERSKVVRGENETSAHEADLRERDGDQDESTESGSHNNRTQVTVTTTTVPLSCRQQQLETQRCNGRYHDHGNRRKQHAAVLEGLGQEHDSGTDERL